MKEPSDRDAFDKQWRRDFAKYFAIGLLMAILIIVLFNIFVQMVLLYRIFFVVVYLIAALILVIHIAADIAGPKSDDVIYYLRKYTINE